MQQAKFYRCFLFRYLVVIFAVLIFGLLLWPEDDIGNFIVLLAVYAGLFPLLLIGWPIFHLAVERYKKNPVPLSFGRGLLYALLPLPLLPTLLMVPAWLIICALLLWQLGKWIAAIGERRAHQERVPAYILGIAVFLAVDVLLYAGGMVFVFLIIFAMGAP